MRNLLAGSLAVAALSFALGGMALASTDPTVHQIYEAASSGHLDQAQQMIRRAPTVREALGVQEEAMVLAPRSEGESAPQSPAVSPEDLRPAQVSWRARHSLAALSTAGVQANRRHARRITASRMPRTAIWWG